MHSGILVNTIHGITKYEGQEGEPSSAAKLEKAGLVHFWTHHHHVSDTRVRGKHKAKVSQLPIQNF